MSRTDLHYIALSGTADEARKLLAAFNSRGDGTMIRLLREAGADPTKENATGQSPIGVARKIANYDVAQFFSDLD